MAAHAEPPWVGVVVLGLVLALACVSWSVHRQHPRRRRFARWRTQRDGRTVCDSSGRTAQSPRCGIAHDDSIRWQSAAASCKAMPSGDTATQSNRRQR